MNWGVRCIRYLMLHNKLPPNLSDLKTYIYFLAVSVGQKFRQRLAVPSASGFLPHEAIIKVPIWGPQTKGAAFISKFTQSDC